MRSRKSCRINPTCPGQSYHHPFLQTHTHTRCCLSLQRYPTISSCSTFQCCRCSRSRSNTTQTHVNALKRRRSPSSTFHVDVNGGFLLGALLQTDVATHVRRLSLGDVQRGHPVHLFLPPHLRPLLPLPLHRPHAPATQLERCVERDNDVWAGGDDGGLGVAYNGIERRVNCRSDMLKSC